MNLQFGVLFGFVFLWRFGDIFNRVPRHNSKTYLVDAKVLIRSQTSYFPLPAPKLNSQDRSAAKQMLSDSVKDQGGENIMFSKDMYLSFMHNALFFTGVYFGFFVKCRSKFNAEGFFPNCKTIQKTSINDSLSSEHACSGFFGGFFGFFLLCSSKRNIVFYRGFRLR